MRPDVSGRRGEAGFTLVEILVAMTISLIVLFATLSALDVFTSNAARQTRVTDANEQVRALMDRTVNDLRGASVILRAYPTDLAYAVPDAGGARVERLCVVSGYLYTESTVTPAAAAPGSGCASGTRVAQLQVTPRTAFTYDGAATSATPALVKNVGLTFSLDAGAAQAASSTLQASAGRRAASSLAVGGGDLNATCNNNQPVLSLSAAIPGISSLTVSYATTGGVSLGTATGTNTVQIAAGVTVVVATVTDALGITNQITKSVECAA